MSKRTNAKQSIIDDAVKVDEALKEAGVERVSSVGQLMEHAKANKVDDLVEPKEADESTRGLTGVVNHVDEKAYIETESDKETEKEDDKVEVPSTPVRFDKEAIAAIVKNNDLSLMNKIEKLVKYLPHPVNKVVGGLRGLFDQRVHYKDNRSVINAEQRSFYRNMKILLELPQNEFNELFRYVRWVHQQLVDVEVLKKENLPLVAKVSPIHVMNVFLYCADTDDSELASFVFMFTLLDMRATDKEGILKGQSPDMKKASIKTLFSPTDVEKINKFYNAE